MESSDQSALRREPPTALPGFGHIRRYWDKPNGGFSAKLLPGEHYVTVTEEIISTVLGAGIAVCVRDPGTGVAGMNHFLMPENEGDILRLVGGGPDPRARYGDHAMSQLVETVLAQGGKVSRLEFKIFGGAKAFVDTAEVARRSIAFVQGWMRDRGYRVAAEDLGGPYSRKLLFFPGDGRVRVKKLRELQNDTLLVRDRNYLRSLANQSRPR